MSANNQTNYNEMITPLIPFLNERGVLALDYKWEEIEEKFPRFVEINRYMDTYMDTNYIHDNKDATLTTEQISAMQMFNDAVTEEELKEASNAMVATIIDIVILHYKEIKGFDSFQLRALEDVCVKEISTLYRTTINTVCREFAIN